MSPSLRSQPNRRWLRAPTNLMKYSLMLFQISNSAALHLHHASLVEGSNCRRQQDKPVHLCIACGAASASDANWTKEDEAVLGRHLTRFKEAIKSGQLILAARWNRATGRSGSRSSRRQMKLAVAPASRFSKRVRTGSRVPLHTQAPLSRPGNLIHRGALQPIEHLGRLSIDALW